MAQSFEEKVRERLAAVQKSAAQPNPFLQVLTDFAKGLTTPDVLAEVVHSDVDQRRAFLVLQPAHQPARRNPVVSFLVADTAVILLGGDQTPIQSPEDLEQRLLGLMESSALVESIGEVAALANSSVEGYLRHVATGDVSRDDVLVDVAPDQQAALDAAASGAAVKIVVRPSSFPGAGKFDPQKQPVALESAGLVLEQLSVTAHGGELHISGTKR